MACYGTLWPSFLWDFCGISRTCLDILDVFAMARGIGIIVIDCPGPTGTKSRKKNDSGAREIKKRSSNLRIAHLLEVSDGFSMFILFYYILLWFIDVYWILLVFINVH